jgi:hypothetical protein
MSVLFSWFSGRIVILLSASMDKYLYSLVVQRVTKSRSKNIIQNLKIARNETVTCCVVGIENHQCVLNSVDFKPY